MKTHVLIPTLAKKYSIDISTDSNVMTLFNRLCNSVENQKEIERLKSVFKDKENDYLSIINNLNNELQSLKPPISNHLTFLPSS